MNLKHLPLTLNEIKGDMDYNTIKLDKLILRYLN